MDTLLLSTLLLLWRILIYYGNNLTVSLTSVTAGKSVVNICCLVNVVAVADGIRDIPAAGLWPVAPSVEISS